MIIEIRNFWPKKKKLVISYFHNINLVFRILSYHSKSSKRYWSRTVFSSMTHVFIYFLISATRSFNFKKCVVIHDYSILSNQLVLFI